MNIPKITISEFQKFVTRSKYLYHIRTEDNQMVGYQPNEPQLFLDQVRNEEFERSKATKGVEQCKLIILKGRQFGGTTDTAMFNLDIMLNINMAYGLILAHDDATTPIIYEKYRLAYLNLPDYIEVVDDNGNSIPLENNNKTIVPIKPSVESFSGKQLKFDDKTQSRVLVRTAGSGDNVGKGDTLNFVHLSEYANYDYADQILTSINQSLPKNAFVYSIIESTANGISGKGEGFYNLWKTSENEWNKFQSGMIDTFEGYRPVFVPWYRSKKYRKPLVNGKMINLDNINFHTPERRAEHMDMEEQLIEETFDDRDEGKEAVNWYRWCIKENCLYDLNVAHRYYPTFPDQAFLSSDNSFFDSIKLHAVKSDYESKGEPEYKTGYIDDESGEFVEDRHGNLKIYEEPDLNYENRYIVSLDPSYGIEEGDYACMFVFDRLEDKFVAKWYGNMKEDLLAEEFVKLAEYYNYALVIPEANLKTVVTLINPDGLIPYRGEIYEHEFTSGRVDYGFQTGSNKKQLLDSYIQWLREDYSKILDTSSINEHITFVKKISKQSTSAIPKYEAAEGKHDDQVIAMALCIWAANWWDEEIYTLNESKNDINKIFEAPHKRRRNLRQSQLGKN